MKNCPSGCAVDKKKRTVPLDEKEELSPE